jgi:hypothetical protein
MLKSEIQDMQLEEYERGLKHIAQIEVMKHEVLVMKRETKEFANEFIELRSQYKKALDLIS